MPPKPLFIRYGFEVTVPETTLAERSRSQNPAKPSPSTPLRGRLRFENFAQSELGYKTQAKG
ncbi:MAG: hypothetical protein VKL39_15430 [Leptolyngbyaceae bacterium]|nr:hypothetical protein [Leptolyngbyaceae bacterium]